MWEELIESPPSSLGLQPVLSDDDFCSRTQNILKSERVDLWLYRHTFAELECLKKVDVLDLVQSYGNQLGEPGMVTGYAKCWQLLDTVDRKDAIGAITKLHAEKAVDGTDIPLKASSIVPRLLRMLHLAKEHIAATQKGSTDQTAAIIDALRTAGLGGAAGSGAKTGATGTHFPLLAPSRVEAFLGDARAANMLLPTTDRNLPGRRITSLACKNLSIDLDPAQGVKFQGWHSETQFPLHHTDDLDNAHVVSAAGVPSALAVARALCIQIRAYRVVGLRLVVPVGYSNVSEGALSCRQQEGLRLEEYIMALTEELTDQAMGRMASSLTTYLHVQTHFPFNNSIAKAWSGALEMLASLKMNRDVYGGDVSGGSGDGSQASSVASAASTKGGNPKGGKPTGSISKSALKKQRQYAKMEAQIRAGSPANPSPVQTAVADTPVPRTTFERLPGGNSTNPQKCRGHLAGTCTGPCKFSHA